MGRVQDATAISNYGIGLREAKGGLLSHARGDRLHVCHGQPFSPIFSCAGIILYRMNLEQSACIPISALLLGNKYLT